ncbi:hypothetical protein TNCV_2456191 [Trichonephila clavipes]|nr:hypothetical protein TNCV_2456191 [Trichonephila clavipes]
MKSCVKRVNNFLLYVQKFENGEQLDEIEITLIESRFCSVKEAELRCPQDIRLFNTNNSANEYCILLLFSYELILEALFTYNCYRVKLGLHHVKKETTIARLELLGAAISASLSTIVLKEFPTDNVYFWTDSATVLAWSKREEPWRYIGLQPCSRNSEADTPLSKPVSWISESCRLSEQKVYSKADLQLEMMEMSQFVASFASKMARCQ